MRLDTAEYAYPAAFMCDRLGVSKSGYYDRRHRPESATAQRREDLTLLVAQALEMSDGTYGYHRIRARLPRRRAPAGPELVHLHASPDRMAPTPGREPVGGGRG